MYNFCAANECELDFIRVLTSLLSPNGIKLKLYSLYKFEMGSANDQNIAHNAQFVILNKDDTVIFKLEKSIGSNIDSLNGMLREVQKTVNSYLTELIKDSQENDNIHSDNLTMGGGGVEDDDDDDDDEEEDEDDEKYRSGNNVPRKKIRVDVGD